MTLYHGSNQIVMVIDFAKSKPNKDFGKGFYLSTDKQQALEMAEYKTFMLSNYLNAYERNKLYDRVYNT
ncbi:DUF3990 domain-containing protein [Prevotella sp.]